MISARRMCASSSSAGALEESERKLGDGWGY